MLADRARPRRRPASPVAMIDVVFLLLFFFMLTSTFSRYGELVLAPGGRGAAAAPAHPGFLQLAPRALALNGAPVQLEALAAALAAEPGPLLVALAPGVTAQRLTDLLVVLRRVPGLSVTVLE